jgi:hypothetical protein
MPESDCRAVKLARIAPHWGRRLARFPAQPQRIPSARGSLAPAPSAAPGLSPGSKPERGAAVYAAGRLRSEPAREPLPAQKHYAPPKRGRYTPPRWMMIDMVVTGTRRADSIVDGGIACHASFNCAEQPQADYMSLAASAARLTDGVDLRYCMRRRILANLSRASAARAGGERIYRRLSISACFQAYVHSPQHV